MKYTVLFCSLIIPSVAFSQKDSLQMTHVLKNRNIEIHIDLPQANYNASRFDWTGKIASVVYKNMHISGVERTDDEDDNKMGKGFYNEFGIHEAIGYDSTLEGEWFHKMGIGLLKKVGGTYEFNRAYEIRPAVFTVTSLPDKITIICKSEVSNGYSYILEKEIELVDSGFTIHYRLVNTGEKPIITDEYTHNFIAIDKELIGSDYILRFPFIVRPELFEGNVNPGEVVHIGQHEVTLTGTPGDQFYFGNLSGGDEVAASWELINIKSKIGIRETGSFRTNKVNLWGCEHVISPELFFKIHVLPGGEIFWTRKYTVFELN